MFKFQPISEFVVRVVELVEAEGRALRSAVAGEATRAHGAAIRLLTGLALLLVGVPLIIGGLSLLAVGLMWWLETLVGWPLAAALTGVVFLAMGGAFLWGFRAVVSPTKPTDVSHSESTFTGKAS